MRVHGVGGARAEVNLQAPSVVQVAGDSTAGFYRPWFPGGSGQGKRRREAYCWGSLNTGSPLRALYLIFVAFMFVNLAYWALPASGRRPKPFKHRDPKRGKNERREPLGPCSRGCLRLLGLGLTVEFFGTALAILADLVAWQAPLRKTGTSPASKRASTGALPSWLGWYAHLHTGTRLAIALLVVLALLGVLVWVSRATARSYENKDAPNFPNEDPQWPLTHPGFWRAGRRTINRQRNVHVIAVAGLVLLYAGQPGGPHSMPREAYLTVAVLCIAVATILTGSPWCERDLDTSNLGPNQSDRVCVTVAYLTVIAAAIGSVSRVWWSVDDTPHAMPGDNTVQVLIVFVLLGLLLALAALVAAQSPWHAETGLLGGGMASPLLAGLGVSVATVFGACLTQAVANVLGAPKAASTAHRVEHHDLLLPTTVFAGSVAMFVAICAALLCGLVLWLRAAREAKSLAVRTSAPAEDSVPYTYVTQGAGATEEDDAVARAEALQDSSGPALRSVARSWAQARLTDRAATFLTAAVVPTVLVIVVYLGFLQTQRSWWLLTDLAKAGGFIGVTLTLVFLARLRSALTDATKRRRLGFVWDVGTFWPRACQPFAPPSYAERAVPEVATRLRRVVGDNLRDADDPAGAEQSAEEHWMFGNAATVPREEHSEVLLTGYSQGAPISVAVLAQLPRDVTERMALLTLNAPLRRLYGQVFPAYFGRAHLELLRIRLAAGERWINMIRNTDYIGGWVFDKTLTRVNFNLDRVDQPIMDPPVLWTTANPAPPSTHRHSNVFADPQMRAAAEELTGRL